MAKGRKHDSSSSDRHDRILGTYGYADGYRPGTGQTDLNEDDIWLASGSYQASGEYCRLQQSEPDQVSPNRSGRTRGCGQADHRRHVGGLSLAFEERCRAGPTVIHQNHSMYGPSCSRNGAAASAPVNVPVWSKMVRAESSDSMSGSVELDRDESEWVPPHEYVARAHGKNMTTSVVEGVGRTLKGRDMSRVRDAVWSQTGFFG